MTWKSTLKAAALVLAAVLLVAGCAGDRPVAESEVAPGDTYEDEGAKYDDAIGSIVTTLLGESVIFEPAAVELAYETDNISGQGRVRATYPYDDGKNLEVVFNQETGNLLRVYCWDKAPLSVLGPGLEGMDARGAVTKWYEALPFTQGYAFQPQSEHLVSEDAGMYSFCNTVALELNGNSVELVNPYEEVRITIDPRNGAFIMANEFNYPLLNEPTPEGPKSEAEAIAAARERVTGSGWDVSAEVVIHLPSRLMSAPADRLIGFSVPAWEVTFYKEDMSSIYGSSQIKVYVDLYTGEVLGKSSPG